LATANPGKLMEFNALLEGAELNALTLTDVAKEFKRLGRPLPEPEEGAVDFWSNAILKANHYSALARVPALADDSGLMVPALGGRPGIMSARYGGPGLSDQERCLLLLSEMQGRADRKAEFRAALAISSLGEVKVWEAGLKGRLALAPKGDWGFGYDSIFIPDGYSKTLAELTPQEKNSISHRGQALALAKMDLPRILAMAYPKL
jgi:XTP/dITP diphosphohydrolase